MIYRKTALYARISKPRELLYIIDTQYTAKHRKSYYWYDIEVFSLFKQPKILYFFYNLIRLSYSTNYKLDVAFVLLHKSTTCND